MPGAMNYILKTRQYFIDNKIIDMWGALILAVAVVLIYASLLRIDSITRLVGVIKNRKENALVNTMYDENLPVETNACAHQALIRIKTKKLCGFDNVIRQNYCIALSNKYHDLITVFFFRKFRANIAVVLVGFGVLMSKQFPSLGEIKFLKELKRREEQATD